MEFKTLTQQRSALDTGQISAVELTQYYLDRIKQQDDTINSFITVTESHALAQAKAADAVIAANKQGPLTGIPLAQKDIFCTQGIKTTCGSKMLDNFLPPYDATVVKKLDAAGMVMLGKTNMDEFAMGSSNETSYYGAVKNPWDHSCVPGGSSGGAAACIAAGFTPVATGSDTGGSIRQPAALCGITGIKPTYGLVSRYGMIAFASSLDQAGPMAHTAQDCAHVLAAMCGYDNNDSTSLNRTCDDVTSSLDSDIKGLKVGLPKPFFDDALNPLIAACLDEVKATLEKLGATCVDVDLPNMHLSVPAYYIVAPAEASSNLSRYDGVRFGYRCENPKSLDDLYCRTRAEGFGAEVKRRIIVGTYALSAGFYEAYYRKARRIRTLISNDFTRVFEQVDVLLGPTTPTTAFKLGEKTQDPVSMYLNDIYTIAVNLAGLPALSAPAGFISGMPVGLQLIGPAFSEAKLLNVAHRYQQVTDHHLQSPNQ